MTFRRPYLQGGQGNFSSIRPLCRDPRDRSQDPRDRSQDPRDLSRGPGTGPEHSEIRRNTYYGTRSMSTDGITNRWDPMVVGRP